MNKKHSSFSFIALLFMPRLSEHGQSGAIGMLKAGVRVSDLARYHYCHPSTIQYHRDRYQATGTDKDRCRSSQPLRGNLRRLCIDDNYIDNILSGQLLSVPEE